MLHIKYTFGLDYYEVLDYIPQLTASNEVVTDGKILHLEVSYLKKDMNLFIDLKTMEYCYSVLEEKESELLDEIGSIIISKYHLYKNDFDSLIEYIINNKTI